MEHALKRCSLCKQEKHRRRFLTKEGKLDYRCVTCRVLPFDIHVLRTRVKRGLVPEDAIRERMVQSVEHRKTKYRAAVKALQQSKRRDSWARVRGSFNVTKKVLDAYPFEISAYPWLKEVRALLKEARVVLDARTDKEFNKGDALFWYDVDYDIRYRLSILIANFPPGADKCPIQVM